MKPQPKKTMLKFLKDIYPEWRSGASLEDMDWGGKKSCTGRALRRLHKEGKLEHKYEPLEYRHDEQVWYRFKPSESAQICDIGRFGMKNDITAIPPIKQLKMTI